MTESENLRSIATQIRTVAGKKAPTLTLATKVEAQATALAAVPITGEISVTAVSVAAAANAPIVVNVANATPMPKDWIGIYAAGAVNATFLDWQYLNGTQTAPVAGINAASLSFPARPVGNYAARLLKDDAFSVLLASAAFTVTATAVPPVALPLGAKNTRTGKFYPGLDGLSAAIREGGADEITLSKGSGYKLDVSTPEGVVSMTLSVDG